MKEKEENVKVRVFKCLCGKARMLSVIRPDGRDFPKEVKKEHRALLEAGCDVVTVGLKEARQMELCFDCKL